MAIPRTSYQPAPALQMDFSPVLQQMQVGQQNLYSDKLKAYQDQLQRDNRFKESMKLDPYVSLSSMRNEEYSRELEDFNNKWADVYTENKGRLTPQQEIELNNDKQDMVIRMQQQKYADDFARKLDGVIANPDSPYDPTRITELRGQVIDGVIKPEQVFTSDGIFKGVDFTNDFREALVKGGVGRRAETQTMEGDDLKGISIELGKETDPQRRKDIFKDLLFNKYPQKQALQQLQTDFGKLTPEEKIKALKYDDNGNQQVDGDELISWAADYYFPGEIDEGGVGYIKTGTEQKQTAYRSRIGGNGATFIYTNTSDFIELNKSDDFQDISLDDGRAIKTTGYIELGKTDPKRNNIPNTSHFNITDGVNVSKEDATGTVNLTNITPRYFPVNKKTGEVIIGEVTDTKDIGYKLHFVGERRDPVSGIREEVAYPYTKEWDSWTLTDSKIKAKDWRKVKKEKSIKSTPVKGLNFKVFESVTLKPNDNSALEWLKQNPNHAKAKEVYSKLVENYNL